MLVCQRLVCLRPLCFKGKKPATKTQRHKETPNQDKIIDNQPFLKSRSFLVYLLDYAGLNIKSYEIPLQIP